MKKIVDFDHRGIKAGLYRLGGYDEKIYPCDPV